MPVQPTIPHMDHPHATFEEHDLWGKKIYRFFKDRIEVDWTECRREGRDVYSISGVSGEVGAQTTFAYDTGRTAAKFILFLAAGLGLHLVIPHPAVNLAAYVFYGLSFLCGLLLVLKIRKDHWIYFYRENGAPLFCIREAGLRGGTPGDFVEAMRRYGA